MLQNNVIKKDFIIELLSKLVKKKNDEIRMDTIIAL